MRCMECGAEMRRTDGPMTEEYRGETFTVDGIGRWVCDACGNDEMGVGEAERLSRELAREYARAHGLLMPDEIKRLRNSLGLKQTEFEKMLGVSSPTVSRWETGAMQQSMTANRLMLLLRDCPEAAETLLEMAEVHKAPVAVPLGAAPAGPAPRHAGVTAARYSFAASARM